MQKESQVRGGSEKVTAGVSGDGGMLIGTNPFTNHIQSNMKLMAKMSASLMASGDPDGTLQQQMAAGGISAGAMSSGMGNMGPSGMISGGGGLADAIAHHRAPTPGGPVGASSIAGGVGVGTLGMTS